MSAGEQSAALDGAFAYCAELVRSEDKDRFLASLFAPAERRSALHALAAFDLETARVAVRSREAMAGEIRLQWWREVLDGERGGEAEANPVAAALLASLARFRLPRAPLADLLEARVLDLYDDPLASLGALDEYARHTAGALLDMSARALDPAGTDSLAPLIGHGASAFVLTRMLGRLAARQRLRLPGDVLARHGATSEDFAAGNASPAVRGVVEELLAHGRTHAGAALALLRRTSPVVRPAFLHLAPLQLVLDRMARPDWRPFENLVEVPAWRRQWRLWRAARA